MSRIITLSMLFLLLFGISVYAGGSQEVKEEKVRLTVGFRDGEALDSLACGYGVEDIIHGSRVLAHSIRSALGHWPVA